MKLKPMNARGFSHEIVLVMVVVLVGILGSAYLVMSHADVCSTPSSAASDAQSGPVSDCTTSGVVSANVPTGSCTIALSPSTPVYARSEHASVTVKNSGKFNFTSAVNVSYTTYNSAGTPTVHDTTSLTFPTLKPQQSATLKDSYIALVPYSSATAVRATFKATSAANTVPSFSCQASYNLPQRS